MATLEERLAAAKAALKEEEEEKAAVSGGSSGEDLTARLAAAKAAIGAEAEEAKREAAKPPVSILSRYSPESEDYLKRYAEAREQDPQDEKMTGLYSSVMANDERWAIADPMNPYGGMVGRVRAQKRGAEIEEEKAHAEEMYEVYAGLVGSPNTSPEEKAKALEQKNRFAGEIESLEREERAIKGSTSESPWSPEAVPAGAGLYAKYAAKGREMSTPEAPKGTGDAEMDAYLADIQGKAERAVSGTAVKEVEEKLLTDYFTDKEWEQYNYLLGRFGQTFADAYVKRMSDTLSQRKGGEIADTIENAKGPVTRAVQTGGFGLRAGFDQFGGGMKQNFSEEALPTSYVQYGSQEVREGLKDAGPKVLGSSLGQMAYDFTTTTGNMLPSMLISGVTGVPALGTASLAASAKGNAYKGAIEEGMSKEDAEAYSTLVGVSEGLLQYFLGGIGKLSKGTSLAKKAAGIEKGFLRFIASHGANAVSEAREEALQSVLEPIFKAAVTDSSADINWADVAYSGLLGGLTGLAMGGDAETERGNTSSVTAEAATPSPQGEGSGAIDSSLYTREPSEVPPLPKVERTEETESFEESEADSIREELSSIRSSDREFYDTMMDLAENPASPPRAEWDRETNEITDAEPEGWEERRAAEDAAAAKYGSEKVQGFVELLDRWRAATGNSWTDRDARNIVPPLPKVENAEGVDAQAAETNLAKFSSFNEYWGDLQRRKKAAEFAYDYAEGESVFAASERLKAVEAEERAAINMRSAAQVTPMAEDAETDSITEVPPLPSIESVRQQAVEEERQRAIEKVRGIAEKLGVKVEVRSLGAGHHGEYSNGVITINSNSENPVREVFVHELTHHLETSGHYDRLKDMVLRHVVTDMKADVESLKNSIISEYAEGGIELDDAGATRELVAKFCESRLFTDEASIERLARTDRNLFQRVYDWIRDTVAKVGADREARFLIDAQRMYEKALRTVGEAQSGTEHLFVGELAKNADMRSLSEARDMERRGSDSETIRQKTGWFRGADNKWRFEIDDSGMTYSRRGDLNFRERHEEYARYRDLIEKAEAFMLGNSNEWLSEAEQSELTQLQGTWSGTFARDGRVSPEALPMTKLSDYIQHTELFESYPELKNASLVFAELPEGVNGRYNPERNIVTISEDIRHSPEHVLIHEIQHAIQNIEGFSPGANRGYWQDALERDTQIYSKGMNESLNRLAEFEADNREAVEMAERIDKALREDDDGAAYEAALEEAEERGLMDAVMEYDELRSEFYAQKARPGNRVPSELYRDTAGEIEARDAAKRMEYSSEQRRETAPDTGNDDTVFADGAGIYALSDVDEETKRIKAQLVEAQKRLEDMEPAAKVSIPKATWPDKPAVLKWAVNYLKSTGYQIDKQGVGRITFEEKWLDNGLRYLNSPGEFAAFAAVPRVLKRGIEIGRHTNHKGRGLNTVTYAAPVVINGKEGNMAVVVSDSKGLHYKVHRILTPDGKVYELDETNNAELTLAGESLKNSSLAAPIGSASKHNVAESSGSVKQDSYGTSFDDLVSRSGANTEYEGTEATERLGIKIASPITGLKGAEDLVARQKAAYKNRKLLTKKIKELQPTADEREFAIGLAKGIYSEDSAVVRFGPKLEAMNMDKVRELADYYRANEGFDVDMLSYKRRENTRNEEAIAEKLLSNSDAYHSTGTFSLNFNTMKRNIRRIFGKDAAAINARYFDPVTKNSAERIRFINRMYDRVRKFDLSKSESELVQLVIEGTAVQDQVSKMAPDIREKVMDAAQSTDVAESARDMGLSTEQRKAAEAYSKWLQTQARLEDADVDAEKVDAAAKAYSEAYDDFYAATNDFLVAHGYEPIGYIKGYAPHMQPDQVQTGVAGFLKRMGLDASVTELPTEIAGRTADFKPGKQWNPYFQHRNGTDTQVDAVAGFESYVEYMSNVFYHTDDIQKLRVLSNTLRTKYSDEEISNRISYAKGLYNAPKEVKLNYLIENNRVAPDAVLSEEQVNEKLEEYVSALYDNVKNLSRFGPLVTAIDDYTNKLAGKQTKLDRAIEEGLIGRKALNWGNVLSKRFGESTIVGNLSSALNQTAQLPMVQAELGNKYMLWAIKDMLSGEAGALDHESDFLTGKLGTEGLTEKRKWSDKDGKEKHAKVMDVAAIPFTAVDNLASRLIVRAAYLKSVNEGLSHEKAVAKADDFAEKVVGSRMQGARPMVFESKNIFTKLFTTFQLEVANTWAHISRDLNDDIRHTAETDGKKAAIEKTAKMLSSYTVEAFLMNRLCEALYGGTPAPLDLLGYVVGSVAKGFGESTNAFLVNSILRALGLEDEDEEREFDAEAALTEAGSLVVGDLPYVRNAASMAGYGDSSLPIPELPTDTAKSLWGNIMAMLKGEETDWGDTLNDALNEVTDWLPMGNQIRKTIQGGITVGKGGRYSGDELMYPVDTSGFGGKLTAAKALLFGNSALGAADEYYAADARRLSAKQTETYEQLVGAGEDMDTVYDTIMKVRGVENVADSDADGKEKRDSIRSSDMSDLSKAALFSTLIGDGNDDKFAALMDAGMSWDDCMDIYERHRELGDDESMKKTEMATEFAHWVDDNYDAESAALIKEQFKFWNMMPAEASNYEKFTGAGLSSEASELLADSFGALEPEKGAESVSNIQKYRAIADSDLSDEEKNAALGVVMSEGQLEAWHSVSGKLELDEYIDGLEIAANTTGDKDAEGHTIDYSEKFNVMMAVDKLDMNDSDKEVLFSALGYKSEENIWNTEYEGDDYKTYYYMSDGAKADYNSWCSWMEVSEFEEHYAHMSELSADKDSNGNTINGSLQRKRIEYIDGLDLRADEKCALYRCFYSAKSSLEKCIWYNPYDPTVNWSSKFPTDWT